jgi:dTDP-4-dehydrorhamnose 3,5-epimerase
VIFSAAPVNGAVVIDVERHVDERGYLARTYCEGEFADNGLATHFVQSSTIVSPRRNTLRGLHYQRAPHREVKLVRCIRGAARVTIVDLRPESTTYTQWLGVELTQENGRLLYVPEGFAQGYQTLVDATEVLYQMSYHYVPKSATGVRWDDPAFGIVWPPATERIISARDRGWPDFEVSRCQPAGAGAGALAH